MFGEARSPVRVSTPQSFRGLNFNIHLTVSVLSEVLGRLRPCKSSESPREAYVVRNGTLGVSCVSTLQYGRRFRVRSLHRLSGKGVTRINSRGSQSRRSTCMHHLPLSSVHPCKPSRYLGEGSL